MNRFYVTFGDLLIRFHLVVMAKDEEIVRAYMKKKSGIGCWCQVRTDEPDTEPLTAKPVELYYGAAEHV